MNNKSANVSEILLARVNYVPRDGREEKEGEEAEGVIEESAKSGIAAGGCRLFTAREGERAR